MTYKSKGLSEPHSKQFRIFCQLVMKTRLTPDLISLVASETAHISYCHEIINAHTHDRKNFSAFCRNNGIDPHEIRTRIGLAATALGIYDQTNYYDIIGVTEDANDADIKKAFRKKARMLHPDIIDGGKKHNEAFVRLFSAYVHLRDPELRRVYDESRLLTGNWIEAAKVTSPPIHRQCTNRFFSWIFIIIGGILIVAYPIKVSQIRSSYLYSVKTSESRVEDTVAAIVSVPANRTSAIESTPLMAVQQGSIHSNVKKESSLDTHIAALEDPQIHNNTLKTVVISNSLKLDASRTNTPNDKSPAMTASRIGQKDGSLLQKSRKLLQALKTNAPNKIEPIGSIRPIGDAGALPDLTHRHSGKPATVERGSDAESLRSPQTQRVISFLNNYTKTYEKRNLEKFKKFFTNNALEQGRPFKALLPTYQKTFNRVEALQYKIELKSVSSEKGGNKIYIEGSFTTRYLLPQNDWGNCNGLIRMELLDEPEGLLVSRLDYDAQWQ